MERISKKRGQTTEAIAVRLFLDRGHPRLAFAVICIKTAPVVIAAITGAYLTVVHAPPSIRAVMGLLTHLLFDGG